jgi:hypothetical protein
MECSTAGEIQLLQATVGVTVPFDAHMALIRLVDRAASKIAREREETRRAAHSKRS